MTALKFKRKFIYSIIEYAFVDQVVWSNGWKDPMQRIWCIVPSL